MSRYPYILIPCPISGLIISHFVNRYRVFPESRYRVIPDIGYNPISGNSRYWVSPDIGSHKKCPDIRYDIMIYGYRDICPDIRTYRDICPDIGTYVPISGHVKNPDGRDRRAASSHRHGHRHGGRAASTGSHRRVHRAARPSSGQLPAVSSRDATVEQRPVIGRVITRATVASSRLHSSAGPGSSRHRRGHRAVQQSSCDQLPARCSTASLRRRATIKHHGAYGHVKAPVLV
jgi:hypothetical protein